jgi:predicted glycoside hydrolase/deacetylase ChbG (UPF0249 family)
MTLKRLIVNADGLGRSAAINRGVVEANLRGILTSASLAVIHPAASEAAVLAQDTPGLGIGLQLAFTGTVPVLPPERVPSLVDFQGRLPSNPDGLQEAKAEDLLAEARAQLRRFRELMRREPTHFDTHQHAHRRPDVLEAVLTLAWETGLPVRRASADVHQRLQREGIRTTDHFVDDFHGESATLERLVMLLSDLAPGTTEMTCQPAMVDEQQRLAEGDAAARGRAFDALVHREARQTLQAAGVRLIRFGDL